jgi:hypothetical protein
MADHVRRDQCRELRVKLAPFDALGRRVESLDAGVEPSIERVGRLRNERASEPPALYVSQ